MSLDSLNNAIHRTLIRGHADGADGQFLDRFVAGQDQAAFEEIVRRHGPMVLQVCRRILGHHQDAEDAFQATFLVLSREARKVAVLQSIGGWLHGVAYRTALNARKLRRRRPGTFDSQASPDPRAVSDGAPGSEFAQDELRAVLDEELARLPGKYRMPMVLCYLEGKSTEEAARQLGWPSGTVKTQMFRAREMLRKRLTQRGMTLAAATAAVEIPRESAQAALSASLLASTTRSAAAFADGTGAVPAHAAQLAGVVLKDLPTRKLRWVVGLFLILGSAGVALALTRSWGQTPEIGSIQRPETAPTAGYRSSGPCHAAVFSTDPRLVASVNINGEAELWDIELATGTAKLRFNEVGKGACCIAFAPDDSRVAVGCRDGSVRLSNVTTGANITSLTGGHRGESSSIVFAPNGQALAMTVPNAGLTIWDLRKRQVIGRFNVPGLQSVTFSPDGAELLGLTADFSIKRWDTATFREKPIAVPAGLQIVALAAGGRSAVALQRNRTAGLVEVGLLDLQTLKVRPQFVMPNDIGHVMFFVSSAADVILHWVHSKDKLEVWDVAGNRRLRGLDAPFITCIAHSPDGKYLLVSGYQHEVKPGEKTFQFYTAYYGLESMRRQLTAPKK